MYAGRVACCLPVSEVEYASRGVLPYYGYKNAIDGQTDARPLHYAYR